MGSRRWIPVILAWVAPGCTLGPDYLRPDVAVPESWRVADLQETASLADVPWWELFQDPVLQELIRVALTENQDLKIAVERIEGARAQYGFTRADFYPKIDVQANAGALELSGQRVGVPPGIDLDGEFYSLRGTLFWELDVFGRIRRATEAERAVLLATEETRRAVAIALVADVARAYMELRELDMRLEISRGTLEARREYMQLSRDRFEGGKTSELDWRQAEAEYHRVAAFVAQFEALVAQKENELSVLLGRNPGAITRGMQPAAMLPPPAVPSGLPSDLLERRPDIRYAEALLASSSARIGEAKALLYPSISLTGDYGWASQDLGDLLEAPSRAWSLGANLLQPIFNAGQNRRRVEIAESRQRQALYEYELSILRAFREVEDALVDQRATAEQRLLQGRRVEAERQVLALAELRYRGGVASYLQVLDAQRSLFNAELAELQAVRDQLLTLVRLYKALGGGWGEVQAEGQEATGEPTP